MALRMANSFSLSKHLGYWIRDESSVVHSYMSVGHGHGTWEDFFFLLLPLRGLTISCFTIIACAVIITASYNNKTLFASCITKHALYAHVMGKERKILEGAFTVHWEYFKNTIFFWVLNLLLQMPLWANLFYSKENVSATVQVDDGFAVIAE